MSPISLTTSRRRHVLWRRDFLALAFIPCGSSENPLRDTVNDPVTRILYRPYQGDLAQTVYDISMRSIDQNTLYRVHGTCLITGISVPQAILSM